LRDYRLFSRGRLRYPTTWEGRYAKATKELKEAEDEIHRFYALAALDLAPRYRSDWNYGNAIHDGRMGAWPRGPQERGIEMAKRELLLAGATPGSPQLDNLGPNMSLAKDLLQQKQTDAVVEYVALCARFWEVERGV
jgi:hypothetical protein